MSDPAKSATANPPDPREARLAAALRENLKRRKAQARARAQVPAQGAPEAEPGQPADVSAVRDSPQSHGE